MSESTSTGSSLNTGPRDGFGATAGLRARAAAGAPGTATLADAATELRPGTSRTAGAARLLRAGRAACRSPGTEAAAAGGTAASTGATGDPTRSGTQASCACSSPDATAPCLGGSANTRKLRDRLAVQPACNSMFTTGSSTGTVVATRIWRSPVLDEVSTRERTIDAGSNRSPKLTSARRQEDSMLSLASRRSAITKLSGWPSTGAAVTFPNPSAVALPALSPRARISASDVRNLCIRKSSRIAFDSSMKYPFSEVKRPLGDPCPTRVTQSPARLARAFFAPLHVLRTAR